MKSRYGRRKPFVVVLSVVAAISFISMPYIQSILAANEQGESGNYSLLKQIMPSKSVAVLVTCFVVLFDFSSQVALTPFGWSFL